MLILLATLSSCNYLTIFICSPSAPIDWASAFVSLPNNRSAVDLMIVDISDNLSISNLSSLPSFVLQWNKCQPSFLNAVFDFTSTHVHDKDAVLPFPSYDVKIKAELKRFMKAY